MNVVCPLSGETILHIAIVNEDPAMVKFLLDKGADVNARVCGNFFTPDDQRASRSDSLDHEWVNVCKETNYEGSVLVSQSVVNSSNKKAFVVLFILGRTLKAS